MLSGKFAASAKILPGLESGPKTCVDTSGPFAGSEEVEPGAKSSRNPGQQPDFATYLPKLPLPCPATLKEALLASALVCA
jgi:hypothetical protein